MLGEEIISEAVLWWLLYQRGVNVGVVGGVGVVLLGEREGEVEEN